MNFIAYRKLTKSQKQVIFAVTLGNILEWYDIYLYVFWAPIISKLFFIENSDYALFNTILFFALGFIFRPLGGVFFGRLGDSIGRKPAFILSILMMAIPTFLLGLIPTYSQVGILAPIILVLIRILQTFPSGGELPAVFIYLYESSSVHNRKFMTSFAGVGNQIGIILSAIECFFLKKYLPYEFLIQYGWRISFLFGGVIGLFGFYLRYKLHETKLFHDLQAHHKMTKKTIWKVVTSFWKKITLAIFYGILPTIGFHVISILFPTYLFKSFGIDYVENLLSFIIILTLMTIPLPLFGYLGDRISVKKILITASIGILILLVPLYFKLNQVDSTLTLWMLSLFALCITCITALWPYITSNIFHTSDRFTCVGISFNISDGVIGGASTIIAFLLINITGNFNSIVWITLFGVICSLFSYGKLKEYYH